MDAPQHRLGLILSVAFGAQIAAHDSAAADWRAFDSPNFTVLSQVAEKRSREIFRRLHIYMQALPSVTNLPVRPPQVPTLVFLLDERDFGRIAAGRGEIGGMFLPGPFQSHIVVDAAGNLELSLYSIQHEYVHYSIRNAGLTGIPAFYEEGLAQFVQYFSVRNKQFNWGFFPAGYAKYARSDAMSLSRILEVRTDSDDYVSEHTQKPFYARSLLILHYCLIENTSCRDPLLRTVSRLANGEPAAATFAEEFGSSPDEFDRELDRYLSRHPERSYAIVPASAVEQGPVLQPLASPRGEAEIEFAFLLLKLAPRDDSIMPLFESVLGLPEWRDHALAGLAQVHDNLGQAAEANSLLGELMDSRETAPARALVRAGSLLLDRLARLTSAQPPADETVLADTLLRARGFFEAAINREPESAEAIFGYALTQLRLPDDLEASARLVRSAYERSLQNAELAMLLAVHVDALGDRAKALELMRVAVCGAASEGTRELARRQLGQVRCFKAN